MESLYAGQLNVFITRDRLEMGQAAGALAADVLRRLISERGHACVVLAAAPSQSETLAALSSASGVDWDRVTAFHMDEYLGTPAGAPHSFRRYLHEHFVSKVSLAAFHGIPGETSDPEQAAREYAALLDEDPPQLCLAGIGENGHLAFNDPPVADFEDPLDVKTVELDRACREQQVADGAFPSLDQVPRYALTLTIPRLMRIPTLILSVPGPRKRKAVHAALAGPLSPECPASILRIHPDAHLFLDEEAAALIRT